MKVALVHDFLTSFGGAERVLSHLANLFPTAPLYCLGASDGVAARFSGHPIIRAFTKLSEWQLIRFPTAIESFGFGDFDLVISSSNSFAHGVITPPETTHLCYCNSPARYLWDYHLEYLKERRVTGYKLQVTGPALHYLRLWDATAADRPDRYLANSRTVAERIHKFYRLPATVVYPPVELGRFQPSVSKDDYYLMVTRLSEYKRVDLVIRVFNRLKRRLVIVGEGRDRHRLEGLIRSPLIELVGWQSDESVAQFLSQARALIHPQLEDFGLTVVEALASGTPVVAFRSGGAVEIMDERHGVFFDQQNEVALRRAVSEFEHRRFTPRHLTRQAKRFSVERFNRKFMKIVDEIISHPRRRG